MRGLRCVSGVFLGGGGRPGSVAGYERGADYLEGEVHHARENERTDRIDNIWGWLYDIGSVSVVYVCVRCVCCIVGGINVGDMLITRSSGEMCEKKSG